MDKQLLEADARPAVEQMLAARRKTAPPTVPQFDSRLCQELAAQQDLAQVAETMQEEQEVEEADSAAPATTGVSGELRDVGVSDEIWAELEQAKAEAKAEEECLRLEEEQRQHELAQKEVELKRQLEEELELLRQLEEEEEKRREAERRAKEAHEARIRAAELERERLRQEAEARRRQEQAIQERLRQISPCPMGFQWYKSGGGWRCGGGSHFVSDAQLNSQFTH